jgi:hypothetical protein
MLLTTILRDQTEHMLAAVAWPCTMKIKSHTLENKDG